MDNRAGDGCHTSGKIGTIRCNGAEVQINTTTRINSPTTRLTPDKLADPAPIVAGLKNPDGTDRSGFIGGTCIVDGDDPAQPGSPRVAANLYVELAENVLVGPSTKTPSGAFGIMGVRVVRLTNEMTAGRIHAPLPMNAYGFEIILNQVPAGDLSSAEGYVDRTVNPPVLYAYAIETSGGPVRLPCTRDPEDPEFGAYRLRNDAFRGLAANQAPTRVRASVVQGNTLPPVHLVIDSATQLPLYEVADTVAR